MLSKPSCVAIIPARSGSTRIPNKNIRALGGHPVMAYSICAARDSGVYDDVYVMTDSHEYTRIARHYGASIIRDHDMTPIGRPDREWLADAMSQMPRFDCFSIVRPTNPFRTARTIERAWQMWMEHGSRADSLRAIQKCSEHPAKMWKLRHGVIHPLLPYDTDSLPWHSTPYQKLPEVYVQNASLEIAWTRVFEDTGTIAGETILGFVTFGNEGFNLDTEYDWQVACAMVASGDASLPALKRTPLPVLG